MAATAGPRKTVSIYDYPEHLNPFHEEDNHNKIRFWTIGRKLNRSNSITFSGIKDLKNSWAFRSFLKKGKKGSQTQEKSKTNQANGDSSPILFRRAMHYSSMTPGNRSTVGSPERYVYGGSVTPLPRSRFQERLRSSSQYDTNSLSATPRMARSEVTGSRLSVASTNPFDEDPVPPIRASRRKKKRAPLPPAPASADVTVNSEISELNISETETNTQSKTETDLELEDMNLKIELKIVEDEDVQRKTTDEINLHIAEPEDSENNNIVKNEVKTPEVTAEEQTLEIKSSEINAEENKEQNVLHNADSEDNIINTVEFPKVDITKYRRNSSVNEDDIRLRRGNLEDFHTLTNKRSKSVTNSLDTSHVTYDIHLNDNETNGREELKKVVCKVYDDESRKQSITSTEKEFLEIDKATRELEREISKLNSALHEEDIPSVEERLSVSEIKKRFDKSENSSPNPIPKPRRSHYGGSSSPV